MGDPAVQVSLRSGNFSVFSGLLEGGEVDPTLHNSDGQGPLYTCVMRNLVECANQWLEYMKGKLAEQAYKR